MKIKIFIIGMLLALLVAVSISPAQKKETIALNKGKNNVTIKNYILPVYASILVKKYPQIESITLKQGKFSYGYVNVFGGVGINFLIEKGNSYEIVANSSVEIELS